MRWLRLGLPLVLMACGGAAPEPMPASAPVAPPEGSDLSTASDVSISPPDRSGLPAPGADVSWAPPKVTTWKMPNGIEVWYLKQAQAPLLSLRLVTSRGASTDPVGSAGLTALTVDMLDEGAGERTALELADAWQRLATDYGASAATDGVTFSLDMLADQLDPSLALLADVLRRPAFPADEFERRKQQHIASALASEAQPMQALFVNVRRALFGTGYGGYPAGGVRATLETLKLADVKKQYAAVVQPGDAVLVVVGAVARAALEASLTKALGEWKGAPKATPGKVTTATPKRAVYLVDFPGSTQSVVAVGRRSPGTSTDDAIMATVFNWTLGGAFTSRLNLNLREDKGWTYGARASFNRWQSAGMYLLYAKVKADKTRASLDEMFSELAAMNGGRPQTNAEREEAIGGLLKGFPSRFELMSSVAGQLATLRLDARPADYHTTWPAKVAAVTLEQSIATAKKYTAGADFLIFVAGDRKTVEPELASLGLPIVLCDAQGNVRPPEKKPAAEKAPAAKAPAAKAPAAKAPAAEKPAAEVPAASQPAKK